MGKEKNKQGATEPPAPLPVDDNAAEEEQGGGGGEEKEKNDIGAGSGGGKKEKRKDEGGSITVVLKVDMHCEGCSKKVIKSVRGAPGVEAVKADAGSGTLTVVGKLDPWMLRERVETKNHKKVDLVSPTNYPKKPAKAGGDQSSAAAAKKSTAAKQPSDNKPQEKIVVTTVTMKLRLHCEGCIRRIRKTLFKIKGVDRVVFDTQTDQVTVTGTMDAKQLPETLKSKLKREVEVVNPKKEGGGGGKKDKAADSKKEGGGGGKKDKAAADSKKEGGGGGGGCGGGKQKGDGGNGGGNGKKENNSKAAAAAAATAEPPNEWDYHAAYGYRMEMVHAPQLFSDENPNSCSVM